MQEKEQLLKDTIERTQKIIKTNAESISNSYDKQVDIMIESRIIQRAILSPVFKIS